VGESSKKKRKKVDKPGNDFRQVVYGRGFGGRTGERAETAGEAENAD